MLKRSLTPAPGAALLFLLAASIPLPGQMFDLGLFSDLTTLSATVVETDYYIPGHCPDSSVKGSCTYVYTSPDPYWHWNLAGCVQRVAAQTWVPASGSRAGMLWPGDVESWSVSADGLYRYRYSEWAGPTPYTDSWLYEINVDLNTGTVDFSDKQKLQFASGDYIT